RKSPPIANRSSPGPAPPPPVEQLLSPPPLAPGQHAPCVPEPPAGRQSKPDGHMLLLVSHVSVHSLVSPTWPHWPLKQSVSIVHVEPSPPGVFGAGTHLPMSQTFAESLQSESMWHVGQSGSGVVVQPCMQTPSGAHLISSPIVVSRKLTM